MADAEKPSATSTAASQASSGSSKRKFKDARQSGRGGKHKNIGKEQGRANWERKTAGGDKRKGDGEWREFKRRRMNEDGTPVSDPNRKNPFSQEEIDAEAKRPKRKVAVMVGYSGTGYKGMQINHDEPTIERDLFRAFVAAGAISKANADDPRKSSLVRCARTDKGVHAAGNVISLKLIIEDEDIVDKINEALPTQIRVWDIQRTNNSFSCYQGCDSRWYEYLMPSYCLLPPHPQTYLGKQVADMAKSHGAEADLEEKMSDVKDFWAEVEEKEIKPVLDRLDPEVRAKVLERMHTDDYDHMDDKTAAAPTEDKEDQSNGAAAASEEKSDEPSQHITLETAQPKKRELTPLDFALRDIKAAYMTAKRRYRISATRMTRLQSVLDKYVGTKNYHNYTVQKAFSDPSAKRHIKSFVVNQTPIIINDTEWLSLKVHGQSFMMHQIRKMVGLASLVVRCGTTLDRVDESYGKTKMAIPKAPGLGLLLERPVFENYNRKATEQLGKETIDFSKYEERMLAFKDEHIYKRIFEVEEKENAFHMFFNQIDRFKQNHFLWVTAGGMAVSQITGRNEVEAVDKELGDEDEDPENGEG